MGLPGYCFGCLCVHKKLWQRAVGDLSRPSNHAVVCCSYVSLLCAYVMPNWVGSGNSPQSRTRWGPALPCSWDEVFCPSMFMGSSHRLVLHASAIRPPSAPTCQGVCSCVCVIAIIWSCVRVCNCVCHCHWDNFDREPCGLKMQSATELGYVAVKEGFTVEGGYKSQHPAEHLALGKVLVVHATATLSLVVLHSKQVNARTTNVCTPQYMSPYHRSHITGEMDTKHEIKD